MEQAVKTAKARLSSVANAIRLLTSFSGEEDELGITTLANRLRLAMRELNEVLGGGIVPGSLVLVGGDPGIGKSTLLLQLASEVAGSYGPVLYVSGEESVQQLKLRAQRLGIDGDRLMVLAENDLESIVEHLEKARPMMAVIDSIQTVFLASVTSAPGSVSQVRECAGRLMLLAKSSHIPIFLVGHVNKEGAIAGPRVLEHIVDTVLYLEGERHHSFRILRSQKNRFGSTDEIGVFEMRDSGMHEVSDPSRAFLQDRSLSEVGNVVHVALEGSRPLLVELQSLTTPSRFGAPRRSVNGIDLNRLHMLVAVLERRAHLDLGGDDVFVNAAGGVRLTEPAADLAVALAIWGEAEWHDWVLLSVGAAIAAVVPAPWPAVVGILVVGWLCLRAAGLSAWRPGRAPASAV